MVVFSHITMYIEDDFKKDLEWLLKELKQEELANAYSSDQIKFPFRYTNDDSGPSIRCFHRLFKLLEDRKAITIRPFFHGFMTAFDGVFQMQGADPLGYYIRIQQPMFDQVLEEITNQKATPVEHKVPQIEIGTDTLLPTPQNSYYITINNRRKVLLNNTFILSSPNFNGENHQFIEYVLDHPNETLSRGDFLEKGNIKLKKKMHSILGDLGFTGELRKMFFSDVAKSTVRFRNNVLQSQFDELEIDAKKLEQELSGLDRTNQKQEEVAGDSTE